MPLGRFLPQEVLLVPLDDRPCCYKFVQRLADMRDCKLLMPPRELLGNLHTPGNCEEIWKFIRENSYYDLPVLVSLDMLLWGGLVASRHAADVSIEDRRERLGWIDKLQYRKHTYVYSTIQRVSPTILDAQDAEFAGYLAKMSLYTGEDKGFPPCVRGHIYDKERNVLREYRLRDNEALWQYYNRYLEHRDVKHSVNKRLLNSWLCDFTDDICALFTCDDYQIKSYNVIEFRDLYDDSLSIENGRLKMGDGADEVSMLFLARAFSHRQYPKIGFFISDMNHRSSSTKYEGRCLMDGIRHQAEVVSCHLVDSYYYEEEAAQCQKQFWVWTPFGSGDQECVNQSELRHFDDRRRKFIDDLKKAVASGKTVVVADVGYTNGADKLLVKALIDEVGLENLGGYAGWGTAANTLGTALATVVMLPDTETKDSRLKRVRFLLERLADDYLYQAEYRAVLVERCGCANSCQELSDEVLQPMCELWREKVSTQVSSWLEKSFPDIELEDVLVSFPWNRLFETELDLHLRYKSDR